MLFATTLLVLGLAATSSVSAAPTREIPRPVIRAVAAEIASARLDGREISEKDKRDILCSLIKVGCDDDAAAANADSSGYAPWNTSCPAITWIRPADGLSTHEQTYLSARQSALNSSWTQHLSSLSIPAPSRMPIVSLALSGGGYRAMISGSGGAFLKNTTSGSVGDLVSLSSYVSGLSGGSWAVSSYYAFDGASPDYLVENEWNLASNLILPSDNKVEFYSSLVSEVDDKKDEGFEVQVTDYWALALSDHLFPVQNRPNTHPNLTMNDLNSMPAVLNHSLPYPIIIAAEREPGELVIAENATMWEFTLGEFGAWTWGSDNRTMGAMTNIQYLGTNLSNGQPVDPKSCWQGYSNLGFVAGTSSTLFNGGLLQLNSTDTDTLSFLEKEALKAIEDVLSSLSTTQNDVAIYVNPFINWNATENPTASLSNITLVDAGETNQNLPIEPLLIPYRKMDAIVAFDNSADTTYSWPNGSALYTTYTRAAALAKDQNVTLRMPKVPSTNGFVNGGLNTRPTFFGCNDTTTPVIIYIPNYPWSYNGNTSTYKLAYTNEQALGVLENGHRGLDLNGTISDWPTCLTCAFVDNAITENGTRSDICQGCFDRFCWNGVDNQTAPAEYEPVLGTLPPFIQNYKAS